MRILIHSYAFSPSVGGIETVTAALAREFQAAGHEVRVATETAGPDAATHPFPVFRQATAGQLRDHSRWCDVLWQNNISLRMLWPHQLTGKPSFITAQTWIYPPEGKPTFRGRLKAWCHRPSRVIAISHAIARHLLQPAVVIGNPFAPHFGLREDVNRDRELIFVGRLVSDKGCDILLRSLHELSERGLRPGLTIVGDGPDRGGLQQQVVDLKLDAQVTFAGRMGGEDLVRCLNRHKVMVIPSKWQEPFGVVALEGAACGCHLVGSELGGLPEAIGPCGITFRNGDSGDLAAKLEQVLAPDTWVPPTQEERDRHLAQFRADNVAARYLKLFTG